MNTKKITLPATKMLVCLIALLSLGHTINGQSNARFSPEFTPFSQFYFQPSFYNPAYIANEYSPTYWFSSRTQNSLQDKSRSYNATYQVGMEKLPINWAVFLIYQDLRTDILDPNSVVSSIYSDFTAFQGGIQANFDFDIGEKGIGKVGLAASMLNFNNIDTEVATTAANPRTWQPSIDMGVLFNYEKFHLGVGFTNSNQPRFDYNLPTGVNQGGGSSTIGNPGQTGVGSAGSTPTFQSAMYINAMYRINLTETFMIEPHVLVRQTGNTSISINSTGEGVNLVGTSIDLALILNYYNFIFAGYSYKPNLSNDGRFLYSDFGGSVMAGIRFNETYHFSFSWDLRRENTNENTSQFEIGIGAYLFGEYLFGE